MPVPMAPFSESTSMNQMKISPSPTIIWISILINILFCCLLLPLLLKSPPQLIPGQVLETLFWQGVGLTSWPVALIMMLVNPPFSGSLPRLSDIFSLILFPMIEINLLLILIFKKNKWIPLILTHLLILLSFIITWKAVLTGYNFMVG